MVDDQVEQDVHAAVGGLMQQLGHVAERPQAWVDAAVVAHVDASQGWTGTSVVCLLLRQLNRYAGDAPSTLRYTVSVSRAKSGAVPLRSRK